MITIISGTHRDGSNSAKIAKNIKELIGDREDVKFLNLANLPNDFLFEDTFGASRLEFDEIAKTFIADASRLIFVIPEYNGSFPGVLKAFVDAVDPKMFHDKKACLIGVASGHSGALRPLDHFTDVLHHLKVEVLSDKPKLSAIHLHLDEEGRLTNEDYIQRIESQLSRFLNF